MAKESIILTPNRRLVHHLHKQSCAITVKSNITTWRSKKILPFVTWLKNCWQEQQADTRILLNSHQERLLWQQVIKEILGEEFKGLADSVAKAYELMINWQLDDVTWNDYATEDVVIFKRLKKKFTGCCDKNRFVVACQLPSLLLFHLQQCDLEITLTDFDEYPPQIQEFINNLQKSNLKIKYNVSNAYKNSLCKKMSFTKQRDEITTIARWAKQIISDNPKIRIGIVATNLTDLRYEIIKIFADVLGDTKDINVSAGMIFSSLPIISDGLELLTWQEPFSLKTTNKILLSPYIGGAETEKSNRALFDFQLRQLDQQQFSLMDIEILADKYSLDVSLLISKLRKAQDVFAQTKTKKLYSSDWAKIFAQIIQILEWPGENSLTYFEAAAVKRFTKLLQEFATTRVIVGKVSYKQACQILYDLAQHTIFQAKYATDVPINVLGALETAGINFDYLWVMGLDQENWPPAPTPNPFIPIKVQKKFSLPHSSAERELYFCEILIKRFKCSAKEVIFSYVKQIEDRSIAPSFLIADLPEIALDELNLATFISLTEKIHSSKKIEKLNDVASLALKSNELTGTGVRLIESQSLCPFRAFAEFRLGAQPLKQFESGISKSKRGILIHAALEIFWREVKTQQKLCELSQRSLQDLIRRSVFYALNKENFPQPLYLLEQKCLMRLLNGWLEIEKNRPAFEVVATEKTVQMLLGALQVKLRVDRIDKLINGGLLLIDYKTGQKLPVIFDWFGERPKNPQLPLYCVAIEAAQGFAFAQINIASIKLKNISLDELAFGMQASDEKNFKNNISWHELITYWQKILVALAQDFVSGCVQPKPLSLQVCKQCEFGMICRYNYSC